MPEHEITTDHDFARVADGSWIGMRVSVASEAIMVWTGVLDPLARHKASDALAAADFSSRAVVHFVGWGSARDYYRGTPFAPMLEAIHQRVMRVSTLRSAASSSGHGAS